MLHPPEEMPKPIERFHHTFTRIIPHQFPVLLQAIDVVPPCQGATSILRMMAKVATLQYLIEQHLASLLIHRRNHLRLRQSHHLMQHIHHRPGKIPQPQLPQCLLQHSVIQIGFPFGHQTLFLHSSLACSSPETASARFPHTSNGDRGDRADTPH